MNQTFDRPPIWYRIKPIFQGFDWPLMMIIVFMCTLGLVTMYSAGYDNGSRFGDQSRNMALAALVMFVVAQVPPQRLMALAVPLYVVGVVLLILTAIPHVGITKKGATRWLNIGMVIQPSEILKIATPLMLAWWFQRREGHRSPHDFFDRRGLVVIACGHDPQTARFGDSHAGHDLGVVCFVFCWIELALDCARGGRRGLGHHCFGVV